MEVLILMKGSRVCVGGLEIDSGRFVRLLNKGGNSLLSTTLFEVGDIWDVEFQDRDEVIAPHIEDVIIGKRKLVRKKTNIPSYVENKGVKVWSGNIKLLFDGCLGWTYKGSGYVSGKKLPGNSVGFWRPDKDLSYKNGKYLYRGGVFSTTKQIPYKGHQAPLTAIPKETLIRVSLARWWKPEGSEMEDRCYLQLSGWYE